MEFIELIDNLKGKGYFVSEFDTKEDAAEYLNRVIDNTTVAFGGSVTLNEMGLYDSLGSHNDVYWHWKERSGMSKPEILKKAMTVDIYLSSVNGISKDGTIINIDGNGNRVAATIYGHKKVYFVVGENKIADNFEKAMWRARNVASPMNAKRLNKKTPCAVNADRCYDCKSPDRICKAAGVFFDKPYGQEYEVVLIHESLGY